MEYFLLAIVVSIPFWGYFSERKEWNHGICPQTNKPWICFDVDSQGGRGDVSYGNKQNYYIWISYPGIDR